MTRLNDRKKTLHANFGGCKSVNGGATRRDMRAGRLQSGKGMRTNSWIESVRLGGVGMMNWTPG